MSERPDLNKELDGETFRSFYYLKEELINFCRENKLPVSGGKIELTDRIAYFLDTGRVLETSAKRKSIIDVGLITENTLLEEAITCWKYKKSLQGHNRYEKSDLVALD